MRLITARQLPMSRSCRNVILYSKDETSQPRRVSVKNCVDRRHKIENGAKITKFDKQQTDFQR